LIYALRRAAHHERRRLAESGASDSSAHPTPWRATLGLAVPGALAFGLMAFETALINWLLARRSGGPEAITAFAIYFRVYQFMAMPAVATAVAILPFVAKRAGAGDYDGVRRGLVVAHRAGLVYVLLTAPLLWIGADPLAELLSDAPLARQLAREGLRAIPLLVLLSLPGILVRPAFEGLGLGRPGLILAALRHLLLLAPAVGAAIVLAERLSVSPLRGVLAGLATASALSAVIASAWIARTLSARISAENTRRALGRASG
jgi:Na+-driven multidrug efflux pump